MLRYGLIVLAMLLVAGCSTTGPVKKMESVADVSEVDLTVPHHQLSYAAGYQIGDMFQNQKLTIHSQALQQGIDDARKNIRPPMAKGVMKRILRDPKKFLLEDATAQEVQGKVVGKTFLEANSKKAGIVVLESGLQYRVIKQGSGKSPAVQDRVRIKYQGKTLEGNSFTPEANIETPEVVNIQNLVPGIIEGLLLMKEGARWELFLPNQLAYANRGPLAGKTLTFEVELLEVLSAAQ